MVVGVLAWFLEEVRNSGGRGQLARSSDATSSATTV